MSQTYTLTFVNNTDTTQDFVCYQKPSSVEGSPLPLVWFAIPIAPTASVSFSWTVDYQFVWSEVGKLGAGIPFRASQALDASPAGLNIVTLTRDPEGAYMFEELDSGGPQGQLTVRQTSTVLSDDVAVGLNMKITSAPPHSAGTGIYVAQAAPNFQTMFSPMPSYWVTAGQYRPGQVLDLEQLTNTAEVVFPAAAYDMKASLAADETWTVSRD